jgi:ribonucleoside-diphosphate reductase alpha chain
MENKRCSKCEHKAVTDEIMWDLGAGLVLCDPCHDEWLEKEGPREERGCVAVEKLVPPPPPPPEPPTRHKLPRERSGFTHEFTILAMEHGEPVAVKGYLTIGLYEDGRVGEIFIKMSKQGSQVSGFVDAWAISVSMLLQMGVSLDVITRKFRGMRFEPSGRVEGRSDLALSPIDYVCKYLRKKFVHEVDHERAA